ncbi:MAG: hypothetical protein WCK55_20350 [Verrucomicrobiota bacterium]
MPIDAAQFPEANQCSGGINAYREEAEREIASACIERLRQFLAGERPFDDSMTVDEYVVPVTVFPDGSITDEDGAIFPNPNW